MSEKTTPVAAETEEEFLGSLTGFDELAISTRFDATVAQLAAGANTTYLRALIFVHQIRQAQARTGDQEAAKTAKQYAMGLTIKQCLEYFAEPPADDGEEPPAGEAQPAPTPAPTVRPTPVSNPEISAVPTVIEVGGSPDDEPSTNEQDSSRTSA